ncbi:MAG: hypothetical protein HY831_03790 [Candidatus Aenigmarchaeota archaeon]|nr:hypothetical protein [Candidatus Aenigmarchaeota archaeon]
MAKTAKSGKQREENIKVCPKCGNQILAYSAGIDIGLIYATCTNCGYRTNQNMFPDIPRKEANKLKVIKGEKLAHLRSKHFFSGAMSKWIGITIIILILLAAATLLLR